LSIIDLSGGKQPIANEDGSVVTVFNGEIYNFRELRAELEAAGHVFRTHSDTEVIVHGYEQWGDDFVTRLNGMFGIALYDMRNGRLLLARDHVGIKPLYYAWTPDALVWGSEIKSLLASGLVPRDLDMDALGQFMAWEYCPGESTLLKSVRKLLPGRMLTLDLATGRHEIRRYWQLPEAADPDGQDDAWWLDRVDEALRAAVRRQLVSDVPLGAFLSGGVDSSLITAAMGEAVTFSIGFEDPTYNELKHSTSVAHHLGVQHITEVIRADALELFDHLMHFMDDPIGDSSIFPTYLVSRLARRHVTVSLSGDGGDELFGGYETYLASGMARRYDALPRVLRKGVIEPAVGLLRPTRAKKGLVNKAMRFVEGVQHDPGIGHARWRLFLTEQLQSRLFTPGARAEMVTPLGAHIEQLFEEARDRDAACAEPVRGPVQLPARRHPHQGGPHVHGGVARVARALSRQGDRGARVPGAGPAEDPRRHLEVDPEEDCRALHPESGGLPAEGGLQRPSEALDRGRLPRADGRAALGRADPAGRHFRVARGGAAQERASLGPT
jgi:asparagine synthase (glutamine-hydrolysing)